jgi:hypothetical protein
MAVFVAVADESEAGDQTGPFVYGGFVAPALDWMDWFTPAWEQWVLNAKPPLKYFHMTEIRTKRFQDRHGLTSYQAEDRIDAAVRVIANTGSLHLVRTAMDGRHFREVFKTTQLVRTKPQPAVHTLEPDYIGFLGFAYGALHYVATNFPDAERVDFVVERKARVTHYMRDFMGSLAAGLERKGESSLMPLIGEFMPGGKERAPLQAADLAMWHLRRYEAGECDEIDLRRLGQMFDGREMTVNGLTQVELAGIGDRSKLNSVPSPFKPKQKFRRVSDGSE